MLVSEEASLDILSKPGAPLSAFSEDRKRAPRREPNAVDEDASLGERADRSKFCINSFQYRCWITILSQVKPRYTTQLAV